MQFVGRYWEVVVFSFSLDSLEAKVKFNGKSRQPWRSFSLWTLTLRRLIFWGFRPFSALIAWVISSSSVSESRGFSSAHLLFVVGGWCWFLCLFVVIGNVGEHWRWITQYNNTKATHVQIYRIKTLCKVYCWLLYQVSLRDKFCCGVSRTAKRSWATQEDGVMI